LNLSGTWDIAFSTRDSLKRTGTVNIAQDLCERDFLLSGQIEDVGSKEGVDFMASIGGIHEGEILFVYENFIGERGVCRGVTPALGSKSFSVRCTDLYGSDKDGEPRSRLIFTKQGE